MDSTGLPAASLLLRYLPLATERIARLYVCLMLNVYGWGKLLGGQFFRKGQLPDAVAHKTIEELSGFETAWTFFGYSPGYIWFIGLAQIAGALMLLHNRTKLFGVFLLLPILTNIIVVDLFYQVPRGAMMSAVYYLALLGWVLYFNRLQIVAALRQLLKPRNSDSRYKRPVWILPVMMAVMAVILFLLEQHVVHSL